MGSHPAVRTSLERRPCLTRAAGAGPAGAASPSSERLQQALGNRAAGTFLAGGSRALPMSRPDDPAEREADRLADQVLSRQEPVPLAQVSPASRIIQRQPSPDPDPEPRLPPFMLPGTGLTLFPGPLRLTDLAGLRVPLPASLRLTNALSVGSPPTFVLDVSPHLLVVTVLGRLDLAASTAPGTAPGHEEDEANQARISLLRPIVTFDPQEGRLRGFATLSVPTQYPTSLVSPIDSLSRFRLMHEQYLEATRGAGTMSVPNVGATVFGRF